MIIPFNVSWFRATWNLIQGQLGPGLTCCQQLKVFHTNFANFAKTLEFDICTFNLKISCCHLFIIWRVCVWEGICTNMYLQLYTGNGNSTLGSFALLQCYVVNEIHTILNLRYSIRCNSWLKNENIAEDSRYNHYCSYCTPIGCKTPQEMKTGQNPKSCSQKFATLLACNGNIVTFILWLNFMNPVWELIKKCCMLINPTGCCLGIE